MCVRCPDPANVRVNFHGWWPGSAPHYVNGELVRGITLAEYQAQLEADRRGRELNKCAPLTRWQRIKNFLRRG